MKYTEGMLRDGAMEGKNILITGGGTGLGRSMGEYFLKLGANLIITSRRLDVLQQTADEMQNSFGGKVLALRCDVREIEQVEKMWAEANAELGQIHGVLNNAAGNFISPTEMLSANAFQTVVDIVQKGTSNVTLTAGKHWIKNKQQGTFLNIVTTYAWTGSGYVVPSAVAKAGVLALTRSLAVEWAKFQIRSNAIAPGPFPTEGAWSRLLPGELVKKFDPAKKIPVGRVGEHQELANLAAYLMSDFSAFVNGEVVTIDGGEWLKGAGEFSHLDQIPNEMWAQLAEARKKK
ncbi:SDR family oxidoreductase [Litoribacter ruber]|uniref:SDR family oxidoreductase n=1 Tax=Litoribacter ruber TaxID=702568 RepID=A0AAP2CH13_9BACT|nr:MULTISPECIES: SDR family oxidoreductase [Litoribacter]MBS9523061.1 SDR family oxidoreductase [Litoribacter alkaliphilus]MBT0810775.1 SDR family oxidoreductase [Litoribacter ruber]